MSSTTFVSILSAVLICLLGFAVAANGNNKQTSSTNNGLPYANSVATSSGTVPDGTINLGNTASAGYSTSNGFQASSNTQNSATGPNASIQSSATANAISGVLSSQNWNVVANGNGVSSGTASTGQLQNQDQSNISATQNILGQGQSQINGTGTNLNLQSTANAAANAQLTNGQQSDARSKGLKGASKSITAQSGNNRNAVSYQPPKERKSLLNVLFQQNVRSRNAQQSQPARNLRTRA